VRAALTAVVAVAVALAFADSSVVVLALPDLYADFDTSLVAVSWVVTTYNVAVAVAAAVLFAVGSRARPVVLAAAGFTTFALASIVCGAAPTFEVLLVARVVQGVGAALLLGGSLPVLLGLTDHEPRARATWALAGTLGAALGPALGGVLTELFTWRSIFWVQAPVALAALAALAEPGVRDVRTSGGGRLGVRPWIANGGYVLLFAALVGALFLAVLLAVAAWRFTPIEGAVAVSALPVAALAVRPLARHAHPVADAAGGGVLLGGGLVALAFLPGSSAPALAAALAACGAGLGLLGAVLGDAALGPKAALLRPANLTIAARHSGFVLGLVVVAPLLSADLESAQQSASLASAQVILDARVPLSTKVPLVIDLRDEILEAPKGRIPAIDEAFEENGVADDGRLAVVQTDLVTAVEDVITRAFRSSFLVAALFGVLAAVPALVLVALRKEPEP
jgi:MFS family permease